MFINKHKDKDFGLTFNYAITGNDKDGYTAGCNITSTEGVNVNVEKNGNDFNTLVNEMFKDILAKTTKSALNLKNNKTEDEQKDDFEEKYAKLQNEIEDIKQRYSEAEYKKQELEADLHLFAQELDEAKSKMKKLEQTKNSADTSVDSDANIYLDDFFDTSFIDYLNDMLK